MSGLMQFKSLLFKHRLYIFRTGEVTIGTRGPTVNYTWVMCVYCLVSICLHSKTWAMKLQKLRCQCKLNSQPTDLKRLALFLLNVVTKVNGHRWNH